MTWQKLVNASPLKYKIDFDQLSHNGRTQHVNGHEVR